MILLDWHCREPTISEGWKDLGFAHEFAAVDWTFELLSSDRCSYRWLVHSASWGEYDDAWFQQNLMRIDLAFRHMFEVRKIGSIGFGTFCAKISKTTVYVAIWWFFIDVWCFLMIQIKQKRVCRFGKKGHLRFGKYALTGSTSRTVAWFVLEHCDSEAMNVSNNTCHGNPQPSFLGVMTHILWA